MVDTPSDSPGLRTQDSRRLDSVADYAAHQECRAVYLRSYFGEEGGDDCGLCTDACPYGAIEEMRAVRMIGQRTTG